MKKHTLYLILKVIEFLIILALDSDRIVNAYPITREQELFLYVLIALLVYLRLYIFYNNLII